MREIVMDGREIADVQQLHAFLKTALDLPECYGRNLDALWDCLTGHIELPLTLRWVRFEESERKLGEYNRSLLQLFQEADEEVEGFTFVLES